jgi:hypothetical protein
LPVNIKAGQSNFFDIDFAVFGHQVSAMFCDNVRHTIAQIHPEVGTIDDAAALIYKYRAAAKSEIFVKFDADIGSIVHEAHHAVWNLFEYHGMKRDDEAMAYHLGFLVTEISRAQIEAEKAKEAYIESKRVEHEDWPLGF